MESTEAPDSHNKESGEPAPSVLHTTAVAHAYTTGKLTGVHLSTTTAWRTALTLQSDWKTPDGRPRASSSDCIAAAVVDLFAAGPDPLDIARYSYRIRLAHNQSRGTFTGAHAVPFYLQDIHAQQLDTLVTRAMDAHRELVGIAADEARQLYSSAQSTQRYTHIAQRLAAHQLPVKVYKVPSCTLARMAIERWRRRKPATVIQAAVTYAQQHHTQPHRARKDMGTITD